MNSLATPSELARIREENQSNAEDYLWSQAFSLFRNVGFSCAVLYLLWVSCTASEYTLFQWCQPTEIPSATGLERIVRKFEDLTHGCRYTYHRDSKDSSCWAITSQVHPILARAVPATSQVEFGLIGYHRVVLLCKTVAGYSQIQTPWNIPDLFRKRRGVIDMEVTRQFNFVYSLDNNYVCRDKCAPELIPSGACIGIGYCQNSKSGCFRYGINSLDEHLSVKLNPKQNKKGNNGVLTLDAWSKDIENFGSYNYDEIPLKSFLRPDGGLRQVRVNCLWKSENQEEFLKTLERVDLNQAVEGQLTLIGCSPKNKQLTFSDILKRTSFWVTLFIAVLQAMKLVHTIVQLLRRPSVVLRLLRKDLREYNLSACLMTTSFGWSFTLGRAEYQWHEARGLLTRNDKVVLAGLQNLTIQQDSFHGFIVEGLHREKAFYFYVS